MPKKPFWAHLPQVYKLDPSPHVRQNFQKKKLPSADHKILNKMRVVCEILTSGCQVMPKKSFLAHFPQIFMLGPIPHTRPQPPRWSKFTH